MSILDKLFGRQNVPSTLLSNARAAERGPETIAPEKPAGVLIEADTQGIREQQTNLESKEEKVVKISCTRCGALILPATAKRNQGLCQPCAKSCDPLLGAPTTAKNSVQFASTPKPRRKTSEIAQRSMLVGSATATIATDLSEAVNMLFEWARSSRWRSGDTMSHIGAFATRVAGDLGYGYVSRHGELGEVGTTEEGDIIVIVSGGDETCYLLHVKETRQNRVEIKLDCYYECYNMPPPDKSDAGRYIENKLGELKFQ